MKSGSLSHLRVLDLSRVLAGPWATQILGDLGADVVKVEKPGAGDDTRLWGPPFLTPAHAPQDRTAAYFVSTNRAKRSVAIDMAQPGGQDLIRRLAARADVLVENYKVGGLAKYGLDYASLHAVNPRLVYCSITGFGQSGPYMQRPGYDFMIQGMGGLMSLTGEPDDAPGGGPVKIGVALSDVMTGLYAAIAILAALQGREHGGGGQHIDMALLDVTVATLANQALNFLVTGTPPTRLGNAHPNIVPYQRFATADGHIILAIGNDAQFRRFCVMAGRTDLAEDPRFATNELRMAHRPLVVEFTAAIVASRTTQWWLDELEKAGVPCGPVNDLAEVFADPQVRHRELRREVTHPQLGPLPIVASPIRLSDAPVAYDTPPPLLGEHTHEVLREWAQLDDAALESLEAAGAIAQWRAR